MDIKFIIGHWTNGKNKPNSLDLKSYQLLVDGEGKLHKGMPVGKASSIGGMNSITYNISCCGGTTFEALTKIQIEAFYKACAEKIKECGLRVNQFYTHAEIGEMCRNYRTQMNKKSLKGADCDGKLITDLIPYNRYLEQNISKVDLRELPDIRGTAKQTGDFIRNKIQWYYERL